MADGSAISFTVSFAGASGKGKTPKSFTLRSETDLVRIGRAAGNDVVVEHRGASQYHAELRLAPDASGVPQLHVRDLSMNGTGLKTADDKAARQTRKLANEVVPDGSALLVPMLLKASLSNTERAWLQVDYRDAHEEPPTPAPRAPPASAAAAKKARDGSASEQEEEKDAEVNRMQFVELLLKTREVSAGTTYEEARALLSSSSIWHAVDETTRRECFEIFVEHLGNHSGKKSKKKEKSKGKKEKRRHHEEEAAEAPAESARHKKRKDGEKKGGSASPDRHRKSKREKKGRERSRGRSAGGDCSRSPSRQKKRRRGRSGSA